MTRSGAGVWRLWRPGWLQGLLALVLALGALVPVGSHAGAVREARAPVLLQEVWIEAGTQATVEDVSNPLADEFVPLSPGRIFPLKAGRTLWFHLRLQAPAQAPGTWGLDIPVPLLDFATLYQRDPQGRWQAQRAGDTLAVASWPRPGRYPGFDLALPAGPAQDIYVQVRHRDPIGFALRIAPAAELAQRHQQEALGLGMVLGTLLLLAVSCLIQAGIYRDVAYAWYALYALSVTLTMATVTGVAAHLLWSGSPVWGDAAQGVLPVFLSGVNILFLRHLCGVGGRHPAVDRLARGAGVLVLGLAPVFMVVPGGVDSALLAFALLVSLALTFTLATLAWRRGDPVGGWVILAYLPLALTVAVALLRLNGWLSATWLTLDGSAAAAALAVPLLLLALQARSRERHGVLSRVNKLTQQDALTGLLSAAAFGQQLKAAVSGAIMRREAAAVVLVEVANLAQIRQSYGDAMAEQCLLRAVIKLHRVVRDVDPAGRIGTARFGLIFEGASVREEVQARMVRLVASGLVPARGAAVSVPLCFHVACVMLGERLRTADLLLRDLNQLLDSMSPRSRRPVRFLAADGAAPAAAVDAPESSGLDAGHTDAPESSTPPPASG